jgi:hypothetical protein
MEKRVGEEKKTWFRSERYYHTNDGWWFLTREKSEKGPFDSQLEAENELILYIRKMHSISNYKK